MRAFTAWLRSIGARPLRRTRAPAPAPLPPGALRMSPGYCPVCERETHFIAYGEWLRDHYLCQQCGSIPRERALFTVMERVVPAWRSLRIHESSPGRPESSRRLEAECPGYIATHYFPASEPGTTVNGFRSENLEKLTFRDESFDLVITQDVMEHVLDPAAGFREIARTLAPGGHHIFTTPIAPSMPMSQPRARRAADGQIEYLAPPEYHGNPIDPQGALVTMQFGADIARLVEQSSGLATTIQRPIDPHRGIVGEYLEVMVSAKPARPGRDTETSQ
jgi:SAM-dependent methyltransferase